MPNPSKREGIGERGRAAVEVGEPLVVDVADPHSAGRAPAADPPSAPTTASAWPSARAASSLEVLARLQRGHGQDVRPAEVGVLALGAEALVHARVGDDDLLLGHAHQRDDVALS
jgi:hypothetical protein